MKSTLYAAFFLLLVVSVAGTIVSGETTWGIVWEGVIARLNGSSDLWSPLLDERVPRLLVVLCTGAALATSGAVMQSLFQNPLASPMVLGLTSGGSFAVIFVFIAGLHFVYPFAIPVVAFAGCLTTLLFVYAISKQKGSVQLNTLILTGIALSTVLIAIQGAIMFAFRDRWDLIQTFTEWEAGSTTDRNWRHVHLQLPLTLVGLWGCWYYRYELNILALGEEEAKNLGVAVDTVRWRLFLCVSLLVGGALAAVGVIGFFGLVLPHTLRKIQGPDNRQLIPLCILAGGPTLLCLDLILRTFHLYQFSIGSISAVLGGIFFLVLLFGTRRSASLSYS